jgi:hypothetical protein
VQPANISNPTLHARAARRAADRLTARSSTNEYSFLEERLGHLNIQNFSTIAMI